MKISTISLSQEQINKLKSIQLQLLDDFVKTCEKLGLTYFLCAGTLLGAVRHGGFIPWDDDIDVQMPRQDYLKFIREAKQFLNPKYVVSSFYTEDEFLGDFAKLVDTSTTYVEVSTFFRKITKGCNIDIFPIDFISDSRLKRFFYNLRINIFRKRINKGYYLNANYEKQSLKGKLFGVFAAVITGFMKPEKAEKKMLLFIEKHAPKTKTKYSIVESKCTRLYLSSVFDGTSRVSFEGKQYNAPVDTDNYLKIQYGPNYMELPPIEKRVIHHYCASIDFEHGIKND